MKILRLPRWRISPLLGALLAAGAGALCHFSELGKPLERFSYDLPFALRANLARPEVAIVFMDESAARALGQPLDRPWDRRVFAQLLHVLTREEARLVCFDLVFSTPSAEPEADEDFARAMREHGAVLLGGNYTSREQFGVQIGTVEKPTAVLRAAQAGWGLLVFRPVDPDGAVRQINVRYEGIPSLPTVAASRLRGEAASSVEKTRWLNHYAPAGQAFESVSISDALREGGVPPGFFRGRTVFIGGRYSTGSLETRKEEFGNPYSRWGRRFSSGVEIHATAFVNLLREEWLERLPPVGELMLLIALGLIAGGGLAFLRPHWALLAATGLALLVFCGACYAAWQLRAWFPWTVAVGLQLPLALGWSVGAQYFTEQRRRTALRRAFSFYLSPEMADRIADSNFDLSPGGSEVEATVLFTDLENFTTFSEKLPVRDVSRILIAYFTETTAHILQNKGTIIKYIGDAVMATWNAPLADPQHAQRAVHAAWSLAQASKREIAGYTLRTRVGINTGPALAGNLGSPFRFDYTVIGDTTNFANRLEGMNKYLGTQILVAESTAERVGDQFVLRRLGRFILKGKTIPVALFELLGPKTPEWEIPLGENGWLSLFHRGVDAFAEGDLASASEFMQLTIGKRGTDGPAEFYLRQIALAREGGFADGLIRMEEK